MNTTRKMISKGDRIYARLTMHGRTVTEFMINTAASMTDVLGEIRFHCKKFSGLCRLFIRNHSRGWSEERPLMLYPAEGRSCSPGYSGTYCSYGTSAPVTPVRRMLMPWETH